MRKKRSFDYFQGRPALRGAGQDKGSVLQRLARSAWWWLRQVSGDAAYDNYLRAVRAAAASAAFASDASRPSCEPVLSAEEFYLDSLRRRFSGASRCC